MRYNLLRGLIILVVEDNPATALILTQGLRRSGTHLVEIKASAGQARKRLEEEPVPHLVILDDNLSGTITGTDLALWMRDQPALQDTLRVSYSFADHEYIQARLPDDAVYHDIITKPILLQDLVNRLAALCQQHNIVPQE